MTKQTQTPLRKRDLVVIKIVDWSDDPKDCEPAIDVEVYINGKFNSEKSAVFSINNKVSKKIALLKAKNHALLLL